MHCPEISEYFSLTFAIHKTINIFRSIHFACFQLHKTFLWVVVHLDKLLFVYSGDIFQICSMTIEKFKVANVISEHFYTFTAPLTAYSGYLWCKLLKHVVCHEL